MWFSLGVKWSPYPAGCSAHEHLVDFELVILQAMANHCIESNVETESRLMPHRISRRPISHGMICEPIKRQKPLNISDNIGNKQ